MDGKKKVECTPEEFQKEYEELCNKYSMTHAAYPFYVQERTGTFSLVINMEIVPLPR